MSTEEEKRKKREYMQRVRQDPAYKENERAQQREYNRTKRVRKLDARKRKRENKQRWSRKKKKMQQDPIYKQEETRYNTEYRRAERSKPLQNNNLL